MPIEISRLVERQSNSISHTKFKNIFKVHELADGRVIVVYVLRSARHPIEFLLTIKITGIDLWGTTKE
jgi:hypothetical protein